MSVGIRIRERREELGLSQIELAKRMGLTNKSTISNVENGKDNITMSRVSRFAEALSCTTAYLMGWDENVVDKSKLLGEIAKDERMLNCIIKLKSLPPEQQEHILAMIELIK